MKRFSRSQLKIIFVSAGHVLLLGCGSSLRNQSSIAQNLTSGEAQVATRLSPFEPEDLALNFLDKKRLTHASLSAQDLGLTDSDIETIRQSTHNLSLRGFGGGDPECMKHASNWFVTTIRFTPNAIAFPGQPLVWKKWASTQSLQIDRLPEIRYVVRPFCIKDLANNESALKADDSALHIIFRPYAGSGFDGSVIRGRGFVEKETTGQAAEADAIANAHLLAVSSEEWSNYRAQVLVDWNEISRTREKILSGGSLFQDLLQKLRAFSNGFALEFENGGGPQIAESSPLTEKALAFSKKYATRVNLSAVTAMLSTPSRNWFFSSLQPDIQGTLLSKRMLSFDAKQMGMNVRIFPVTEQMKNVPIQSPGSISRLRGVPPDTFQSHEGVSNIEQPEMPPERAQFEAFKAHVTDFQKTNPTTMSCGGCHKVAAGFDSNGEIPGNNERFIITDSGKMNIIMALEALEESESLNREFGLRK